MVVEVRSPGDESGEKNGRPVLRVLLEKDRTEHEI